MEFAYSTRLEASMNTSSTAAIAFGEFLCSVNGLYRVHGSWQHKRKAVRAAVTTVAINPLSMTWSASAVRFGVRLIKSRLTRRRRHRLTYLCQMLVKSTVQSNGFYAIEWGRSCENF
jgi:hypothetical protein